MASKPAWTTPEFNSLNALRNEPSANNQAIRLEADLTHAEISGSAVTANALLLPRRAAETGKKGIRRYSGGANGTKGALATVLSY